MSARTLAIRGMFQDSALQVLDNKVFRVLLILALFPILITFVIGLHESSFSILFGIWEIDYPNWISLLGEDPRASLVELFIEAVVNSLAGGMGITVCIAATAFFVPRMLEKGSADLVFTKPISRYALYLSRYFTGIFFIAALGTFLTTGMYLGVLVSSGFNYPGILWSALTLIYIFALVHGVTMLIGVLTKSTPAAMILGIMFFFGNGCVHSGWQMVDALKAEKSPFSGILDDRPGDDSGWDTVKNLAIAALDGAHYILPKTSEAPLVILRSQDALFSTGRSEKHRQLQERFAAEQTSDRARSDTSEIDAEQNPEQKIPPGSNPDAWFENHFAWGAAELRYNIWFSILSSLLFTFAVLGLGCWRIRRMDF